MFNKKGKKLLIIGLDGVSHEMLAGNGQPSLLPSLNEFFAARTVRMSVSIPEISAVSWSSFMTGTQAGNHGIFGFVDLVPGTYQYRFPNFSDLKAATFFDELGLKNKRSVIINLPATYPARAIPGVMISGFVALDLEKAVFPTSYIPILKQMGYQIDVDAGKGRDKKAEFLADLHCALKIRKQVADMLWEKENWDVFMFTITETDRLQHFLYNAYGDSRHPYNCEFKGFYQEVDQIAASFIQRATAAGDIEIVALSDHGFAPIKSEVYLNPILKKHGYFSLEKVESRSLAGISPQARAFALDPSRIYIHQKDKYFKGGVAKSDVQKVADDLKQLFESYEINGEKIIRKAYFKEELFSGAQMAAAPDLVLLSKPGYDLKGGLEKDQETGTSYFTGMHQQDNAFFASSSGDQFGKSLTIFDVKGLLYKLLAI